MAALPRKVGDIVQSGGYFTRAYYLRGKSPDRVERALGYRSGRLDQGYWLLFLMRLPSADEFEYRGYTHLSGGIARGHLEAHRADPNAEQMLKAAGHDLAKAKAQTLATGFDLIGHRRLAKLVPVAGEIGDGKLPEYPPGDGFPQWVLTAPLPWVAAAFIAPGKSYTGNYSTGALAAAGT